MSQNTEYTVDPSRLVSPDAAPADAAEEVSLRPKTLDDYIGQEKAKNNLRIYLRAAQQRGEPMDHILLYGPPAWQNNVGRHCGAGDGRADPHYLRPGHRKARRSCCSADQFAGG